MGAPPASGVLPTAPASDAGVTQTSCQMTRIPGLGGAVSDMNLERGYEAPAVIAADSLSLGHDGIGLYPQGDQGINTHASRCRATQQSAHSDPGVSLLGWASQLGGFLIYDAPSG